ncbi:MAG: adenosylcobalamin-dependent ribonucleoside-diphosphate reductase [Candidatus Helarchaeota archaeon]|nr:adenosylcobalamin-dependent ribonucleoside-diphosphate reductase [Candidatus Helarchaeota archaeon]
MKELNKTAISVLNQRYLMKDDDGHIIETPDGMFKRVAKNIAAVDKYYGATDKQIQEIENKFLDIMVNLDFLPNSPTLMNAGRKYQQLAACFVLPIEDSMESIFDGLKNAAIIQQTGGGTGFSFSNLRPKGDPVKSSSGVASGPVSFMKIFDAAAEQIKQGGMRRGANMGILRIDHPDIIDFITVKDDPSILTNFNISVAITDEFMDAVNSNKTLHLINPRIKQIVRAVEAKKIFDLIVLMAWKNADPGVIFIDTINRANPTPLVGRIESTNPCGEVPLLPWEACNLGSINVANFIKDGKIDYERLSKTVDVAVHFLDNVIDASKYPLEKIDAMVKKNRKVGLGIMGFADLLIQLKEVYGSERSFKIAEELMEFIEKKAHKKSEQLAEERGVFPNYKGSIYDGKYQLRNATLTSIAPTGTLSIIAGCSSSIETIFAVVFRREILGGQVFYEANPLFEKLAKEEGFYSAKLMEQIAKQGNISNISEIPKEIREIFVTALEVTPEAHVKVQAVFQKHVDNAVSKTVNLPRSATPKDIEIIFKLAYDLGCKGITVYRYGSKKHQVLSIGKGINVADEKSAVTDRKCPECGATSVIQHARCNFCKNCGASNCLL